MTRRLLSALVLSFGVPWAAAVAAQENNPQKMRIGNEVLDPSQYELQYLGALGAFVVLILLMVLARRRHGPRAGTMMIVVFAMVLVVLLFTFGL